MILLLHARPSHQIMQRINLRFTAFRSISHPTSHHHSRLPGSQRLDIPNHIRILLDTPITAKKAHPRHTRNALADPLFLVLVRLVHQLLRLAIAAEIVADEVVIAMVDDGIAEGGEPVGVAKGAGFDGVNDFGEGRIEVEGAVVVGVAEVFDVFGEVSKEEDVGFADFAGDFNLLSVSQCRGGESEVWRMTYIGTIACPDDQAAVKNKLHVTSSTGLSTCSRDMLADIRSRGDDLSLADIVILDINDLEQIADIWVMVDDLADTADKVDDSLGHPVSRGSLATKYGDSWCKLLAFLWTHGFD